jgi:type II secretory pathway component PulF
MARWSPREKQFFYHQLRTLLGARVPLGRALDLIGRHRPEPGLANTGAAMSQALGQGRSLAAAMADHPAVFTRYEIDYLGAAESISRIPQALGELAGFFREQAEWKSKNFGQSLYAVIVTGFALLLLLALNLLVAPMIADIYGGWNMPAFTRWVFGFNKGMLLVGLPGLAILIVGHRVLRWFSPGYRIASSLAASYLPLLGPPWVEVESGRFARTLGSSLAAGVAPPAALAGAAEFVGHPYLQSRFQAMAATVGEGRSWSSGFKNVRLFPEPIIAFAELGERKGDLAQALIEAADSLPARRRFLPSQIFQVLVVVGALALIVMYAMAVYLPIFSLAGTW